MAQVKREWKVIEHELTNENYHFIHLGNKSICGCITKEEALLIAAAPDLLEALKAMKKTHGMHGPCEQNNCEDCDGAYEKARQVIKQAETVS